MRTRSRQTEPPRPQIPQDCGYEEREVHRESSLAAHLQDQLHGQKRDDRKRHRLFFTGSGLRNQCRIVFYPGRQTGMVVFTNDVLPDSYLEELSDSVLHDLEF